jgi:hypothetical protein
MGAGKINGVSGDGFWDRICCLREMPKLSDVTLDPQLLSDGYYRIGPCEYAYASFQSNFAFTEQALFVLKVIWAPSLATFHRATSRMAAMVSQDDGAIGIMPRTLRPGPEIIGFGQIQGFANANSQRRHFEMDLYSSEDGAFGKSIGHYISLPPCSYFFRSASPVPTDELPFAVICNTKHNPRGHLPLD